MSHQSNKTPPGNSKYLRSLRVQGKKSQEQQSKPSRSQRSNKSQLGTQEHTKSWQQLMRWSQLHRQYRQQHRSR